MQVNFKGVTADYQIGPIRSRNILHHVNLCLPSKSFTAIVGHTGAGKSSLLKTVNGLLLPKEGKIQVGDQTITPELQSKVVLKHVRQSVGMVFQFPESQLFAETVEQDICFGPMNFGVSKEEAKKSAKDAILNVGLEEAVLSASPFSLSGGQQRRVAIAGVLVMNPDVLVLDEPGAGLDPQGKEEILTLIKYLHESKGITTILVTHDMDDVARYADDVVVMEKGKVVTYKPVHTFFNDVVQLHAWSLDLPEARRLQLRLEEEANVKLPKVCLTIDDLVAALIEVGLA
ncbi:Energy-coupling factor transporter ATP-binding protein EcfA2 [Paraliobacillus sp. PM-2]|uniref:energy-coupling factor transporter ATPase n=1 Tax=Paraliobacillus sp. PM-2 TaxID=1462524 RepID=UPI00061BC0F5|nr:energy-coupling factor transporter ATPase [Paraliobacillus sp. PM-2]CQR47460.1 Energy-coupling factor transporter ATP-binding protein EcfA2 [Paraliobacillus sp. PM-2]